MEGSRARVKGWWGLLVVGGSGSGGLGVVGVRGGGGLRGGGGSRGGGGQGWWEYSSGWV